MKNNMIKYPKSLLVLGILLTFLATSCDEEFLDAEPQSFFTPENALNTAEGLKSVLNRAMVTLRSEYYGDGAPMITENVFSDVSVEGTTDKSGPAQDLNLLIQPGASLNSANSNRIGWFWQEFYKGIKYANTVIDRIEDAEFDSDAQKNEILAGAYFHRAYRYYRLTQQFGDVPLILHEITSARLDFVTTARTTILEKMQDDLNVAVGALPDVTDRGQVNKAAALHLLTKVNLALLDFDAAITSATSVINGPNALMTGRFGQDAGDATKDVTWDLHRPLNKSLPSNTEGILLVVDRLEFEGIGAHGSGTSIQRQAVPLWWRFINTPGGQNGMSDSPNATINQVTSAGRGIGRNRGTRYSTKDIWINAGADQRHNRDNGNWMDMEDLVYNAPSLESSNDPYYGKNLELYLPDGTALCSDTIRNWYGWPQYKFFVPDPNRSKPQGGHSDWYIYRIAETHLLRAEANFWNGNLQAAADDINLVRARALADPITAVDVNIGYILDERARELYYEENRKTELTRIAYIFAHTGKTAYNGSTYSMDNFSTNNFWFDRIAEVTDFYNLGVKTIHGDEYTMSPYHVLWPVPSAAINANTQAIINQNEGYTPGAENNIPPLTSIPADD